MTNLDTLLSQALALVNEDRRGELADAIEKIVQQTRREALEEAARRAKLYVSNVWGWQWGNAIAELVGKDEELQS